jgi:hypothetical protein
VLAASKGCQYGPGLSCGLAVGMKINVVFLSCRLEEANDIYEPTRKLGICTLSLSMSASSRWESSRSLDQTIPRCLEACSTRPFTSLMALGVIKRQPCIAKGIHLNRLIYNHS